MMASNASQATIRKIATPAANAPGAGIIFALYLFARTVRIRNFSGFRTRVGGDFSLEEPRDGAAGFGGFDFGVKFGLISTGNAATRFSWLLVMAKPSETLSRVTVAVAPSYCGPRYRPGSFGWM